MNRTEGAVHDRLNSLSLQLLKEQHKREEMKIYRELRGVTFTPEIPIRSTIIVARKLAKASHEVCLTPSKLNVEELEIWQQESNLSCQDINGLTTVTDELVINDCGNKVGDIIENPTSIDELVINDCSSNDFIENSTSIDELVINDCGNKVGDIIENPTSIDELVINDCCNKVGDIIETSKFGSFKPFDDCTSQIVELVIAEIISNICNVILQDCTETSSDTCIACLSKTEFLSSPEEETVDVAVTQSGKGTNAIVKCVDERDESSCGVLNDVICNNTSPFNSVVIDVNVKAINAADKSDTADKMSNMSNNINVDTIKSGTDNSTMSPIARPTSLLSSLGKSFRNAFNNRKPNS